MASRRATDLKARVRILIALTAAAVLASCANARAAVSITSQAITVTTDGARAVITRAPFHLSVQQGNNMPALAEVPNAASLPSLSTPVPLPGAPIPTPSPPGTPSSTALHLHSTPSTATLPTPTQTLPPPQPYPPTVYPSPLGGTPERGLPLYAPLSFLVGSATTSQWGGGALFFQGNELSGAVTGIQYSSRDVISAQRSGRGVSLIVSTDDPTGRRLEVTVAPGPGASIRVAVTPTPSTGVGFVADSFASSPAEAFHGFGGRHNTVNQHGNDFYSWIEEENSSGYPGSQPIEDAAAGQPNYMFPNGPEAAYTAHALFYSSRPYGFMLNQPQFARWRMDSDRPDAWQVDVSGHSLDYTVAPGPAPKAVRTLTAISGRERVPPAWAIAPTLDRTLSAENEQTPAQAAAEVTSDLSTIRRDHLPIRAYQLDAWYLLSPAQQRHDVAELHRDGIHLLRYFRAFVATPTGGWEASGDYAYAISHHLVAMNPNGTPAVFGSPYQNGQAALLDFTNPATVRWWQGRVIQALNQGADGFMQDFGEQIETDWRFHDGSTGTSMHNEYPILYDRATREAIDRYMRRHPARRIFFFTRAGYSGGPGSAAYENAEFLGDNTTSWDHASGIASVIPDELNRTVGGAYGPDTDIGGYLDLLDPPTTPELFDRWAELSALTPFYRVHNSGETGTETPWALGSQTLAIYRSMARLHAAAEPLILKLWAQSVHTGIPVMRPLWLAHPSDPTAASQDEEWELGPNVLVAPVIAQGATSRAVYFPRGCWRNPQTGAEHHGPATITVPSPVQTLPYYFKCGTTPLAPPT